MAEIRVYTFSNLFSGLPAGGPFDLKLLAWLKGQISVAINIGGFETEMRQFLDFVLRSYELHGIDELAPAKIADFLRIRYGGTNDAKRALGPVPAIRDAFIGIQEHLFR